MLKETALRRMAMSLLETGRHSMTVYDVIVSKKPIATLVFILFSIEENLVSFL